MSTSVWMIVCKEQMVFKRLTAGQTQTLHVQRPGITVQKGKNSLRLHTARLKPFSLDRARPISMRQNQTFIKPTWQRKLRRSPRVESFPASIEFHVILAHERVTQDPQRCTMSWNDDRGQSGKSKSHLTWRSQDPSR